MPCGIAAAKPTNPAPAVATTNSARTGGAAETCVSSTAEAAVSAAATVSTATRIRRNSNYGEQSNRNTNDRYEKFPFHIYPAFLI
jgi:hypothetical protein